MTLVIDNDHKMVAQKYQTELQKTPAGPAAQMAHTLALLQMAMLVQTFLCHEMSKQCGLEARKATDLNDHHALEQRKTFNKGILGNILAVALPGALSAASIPLGLMGVAGGQAGSVASQAASTLNNVFSPLFDNQFARAEHQHGLEKGKGLEGELNQRKNSFHEQEMRHLQGMESLEEKRHRALEA